MVMDTDERSKIVTKSTFKNKTMKILVKIAVLLLILYTFQSCGKDDGPEVVQNNAPLISDQVFTVAENIADNMSIGTVVASDPVGNVAAMSFMFENSEFNQSIGTWNVSNVIFMTRMFQFTPFNQDISSWEVGSVRFCSAFANGSALALANVPNFINCTP